MNQLRVYVSGPYTKPDPVENTRIAIKHGDTLSTLGFVPFIPHLYMLWHFQHPHPYDFWMDQCLAWVRTCHSLYRFPGESKGADIEVTEAQRVGIPVFTEMDSLLAWRTVLFKTGTI